MFDETNILLVNNGLKKISFGSFKRYLGELKKMSIDEINELNETMKDIKKVREQELLDALESSDVDSRKVKMCKKRLKQVNIEIKGEI